MMIWSKRRSAVVSVLLLAACGQAAEASSAVMFRDPGCGCCEKWVEKVEGPIGHDIAVREDRPMAEVKTESGVPRALSSCHTMRIEGYVIEGHVPAREINRLLAERPKDVTGLAVAGMPLGSPGMEVPGQSQPYQVIAFGDFGERVYASYP